MQSSEIVFNTDIDLEGIIFPVSNPTESYIDKPVPESLIPFQMVNSSTLTMPILLIT
jgi:hypothetical protein